MAEARYTVSTDDLPEVRAWFLARAAMLERWRETFFRPTEETSWIPESLSVHALTLREVLAPETAWKVAERTYPQDCEEEDPAEHLAASFHQESPARAFLANATPVLSWECDAYTLHLPTGELIFQEGVFEEQPFGLVTITSAKHEATHALARQLPGTLTEQHDGPGWTLHARKRS